MTIMGVPFAHDTHKYNEFLKGLDILLFSLALIGYI